jgi:hypothetical protein
MRNFLSFSLFFLMGKVFLPLHYQYFSVFSFHIWLLCVLECISLGLSFLGSTRLHESIDLCLFTKFGEFSILFSALSFFCSSLGPKWYDLDL